MAIQRLDHVGVVVDDLAAAVAFFVELGLEVEGEQPESVAGPWVDTVVGIEGVRVEVIFVRTPDGHGRLELTKFHSPAVVRSESTAPNTLGLRRIMFAVDDIDEVVARLRASGPTSSARWRSTRTCTDCATSVAPRASSSPWPKSWPERRDPAAAQRRSAKRRTRSSSRSSRGGPGEPRQAGPKGGQTVQADPHPDRTVLG